jgi:hypothetical protein
MHRRETVDVGLDGVSVLGSVRKADEDEEPSEHGLSFPVAMAKLANNRVRLGGCRR